MHEPVLKSRPKPTTKPNPKPQHSNFDPETFTDTAIHDELLEDNDAFTQAAQAMFDTETTRIVEEGVETEENFNIEADDVTHPEPTWKELYRPRKPKFFNRVVMGYEWNKYNQTHYDEANPPPKVVQGYKFNIFYPNLVDSTKTPTYKVERNRQRRRYVGGGGGTSAGEDETCILRFIAGPPYLDVAFRIIDRDWDYSSRFNRGFKSSFDKVCSFCSMGHADNFRGFCNCTFSSRRCFTGNR
jgi:Cactus-binding C-terminus of cactin protein